MKLNVLTLILTLSVGISANAQSYTKVSKTVANDRGSLDHFGHSIRMYQAQT